jgi:signal peptidase I
MSSVRSAHSVRLVRRALDGLLLALFALILVALFLGRFVPVLGGSTFVVAGPSMGEAVPIGSAVVATPVDPRELAVGDIVSMQVGPQKAIFTHRIVRVVNRSGEVWIETAGDANPDPDPAIVPASAVIGRVGIVLPYAGYLLALLSTVAGLAFVCGLGALIVTAAWLLETVEIDADMAPATLGSQVVPPTVGSGAPLAGPS